MAQSDILLDGDYVRAALPVRKPHAHKGSFGRLLVVAGSLEFSGAPWLTAHAAVRAGAGLVYLGVPQCIWGPIAVKCTSAMPFPLPDNNGTLTVGAIGPIQKHLRSCDVVAVGPGLGRGSGVRIVVHSMLRDVQQPVVLDADGLNVLAENLSILDERKGRVTVLTPHDGEFARLCGCTIEALLNRDRVEASREFAVNHGCILVRKGHRTLVALPDGMVLENTCGDSALAKGGSGDVLTGIIAALLAQGSPAEPAAASGVWLHARAGDILSQRLTPYCVTPEDLCDQGLPAVFREVAELP